MYFLMKIKIKIIMRKTQNNYDRMKMSVKHNNIAPSLHQQVQYADLFKGYWIDNWHEKSLIDRLIKIPLCHFEPEMMIIQRTSLRLSFFYMWIHPICIPWHTPFQWIFIILFLFPLLVICSIQFSFWRIALPFGSKSRRNSEIIRTSSKCNLYGTIYRHVRINYLNT